MTHAMPATIHRLQPPIEVRTPLGQGRALFLIDYGIDVNTIWLVCVTKPNDSSPLIKNSVRHFDSNDITVVPNLMLP